MIIKAFDTETGLIAPGLQSPPLVCLTWSYNGKSGLLQGDEALDWVETNLRDKKVKLVNQNMSFDMMVVVNERPCLVSLIEEAYAEGRIGCTMVRQMLMDNARGILQGANYKTPSLADLVKNYLGVDISASKHGDAWRQNYWWLKDVSVLNKTSEPDRPAYIGFWKDNYKPNCWPRDAIEYPLHDAEYAEQVWHAQTRWIEQHFGVSEIPDLDNQCYTDWSLSHLGWGIRTEHNAVDTLSAQIEHTVGEALVKLVAQSFYRADETMDQKKVKRTVAMALGGFVEARRPTTDYETLRARLLDPKNVEDKQRAMLYTQLCELPKAKPKKGYKAEHVEADQALVRDLFALTTPEKVPLTDKGGIKYDEATLREANHEWLTLLADITGDKKLLSSFVPTIKTGVDWPICSYWNVLVASGRTSCRGPNLQQMPRKGGVRECFVPRPGWVFVACDYSTAELRSLAQVLLDGLGYSRMADALIEGKDLHLVTAAEIGAMTYENIVALFEAGDKHAADLRQLAKAPNFGLPGGLGKAKFYKYCFDNYNIRLEDIATQEEWMSVAEPLIRELGGSFYQNSLKFFDGQLPDIRLAVAQEVGLKVSARIIRNWKNAYPEMLEYFAEINQQCEESDTGLFTLTQHKSGRLRGQVGYTDGANTMFQGLTADGAKDALRQVVRECYDPTVRVNGKRSALYGCRVVVFVHDEIIIEAPALNATRATKRLKDAMREAMDRWVSDVPNDTDAAVMGRWFKGAKQVKYDERTTGVYRPVRATKDKIVVDLDKRLVYIGDRTEPLQEQQEV